MRYIDTNILKENKSFRLLNIYEILNKGDSIKKKDLASQYGVSEKTIQRDIEDLRIYLAENYQLEPGTDIIYDAKEKKYQLAQLNREWITNKEIISLLKILLESRGFNNEELYCLIDKLVMQVTPNDRKLIKELIKKERFSYIQPRHSKPLLDIIWRISTFIFNSEIISYTYERQDGSIRDIKVKPVAIMFSEFYFYLIAYKTDKDNKYPVNYRIDRISNLSGTTEKFKIPYADKFDDGEFRKRVQFMYSGELKKLKFEFSGPSIEAILDKIPTAEILSKKNGTYLLEAESFGNGIEMWLRTQGENIKFVN